MISIFLHSAENDNEKFGAYCVISIVFPVLQSNVFMRTIQVLEKYSHRIKSHFKIILN